MTPPLRCVSHCLIWIGDHLRFVFKINDWLKLVGCFYNFNDEKKIIEEMSYVTLLSCLSIFPFSSCLKPS